MQNIWEKTVKKGTEYEVMHDQLLSLEGSAIPLISSDHLTICLSFLNLFWLTEGGQGPPWPWSQGIGTLKPLLTWDPSRKEENYE